MGAETKKTKSVAQTKQSKRGAERASKDASKKASKSLPKKESKDSQKKTRKKPVWLTISWTIMTVAWVGAATIASQLIVGHIMLLAVGAKELSRPVPNAILSVLSYLLAIVLVVFLPPVLSSKYRALQQKNTATKKKNKEEKDDKADATVQLMSREQIGLRGLPTWTDIGLAPVGYVVYFILAAALIQLFSSFAWFDAGQAQDVGFNHYLSGGERAIAFIVLVVIAPIVEEVIFRGWLYGRLRRRLTQELSEIWGILISAFLVSLLFGIVHLQWNVGVNVFALSLVMCAMREITGTIYAGILLHMLKNGIAFFLLYVLWTG